MSVLRPFFYKFLQNFAAVFRPRNLIWHALAIGLTYLIVMTDFDWLYFEHTRAFIFFAISIPAALLGFVVPVVMPFIVVVIGALRKNVRVLNAGYALAQSAAVAWLVSSGYKAITGRAHPELFISPGGLTDITHQFNFGLLDGGIFWGWPSSHTMVAFAVTFTAIVLFPNWKMKSIAIIYALYIGLGVSLTIHWFSDFVAGAILGTLVGVIIGESFKKRLGSLKQNET